MIDPISISLILFLHNIAGNNNYTNDLEVFPLPNGTLVDLERYLLWSEQRDDILRLYVFCIGTDVLNPSRYDPPLGCHSA